jgi:uncharacterized membrane protein YgcG
MHPCPTSRPSLPGRWSAAGKDRTNARSPCVARFLWAIAAAMLVLPGLALRAWGQNAGERILSFHSDITVNRDGSMLVRENIKVRARGEQIKRGIYRDFPTRYRDRLGNRYVVGFQVLEVERDGRPEPYHTQGLSNGVRVYMGAKSVLLNPREHTYSLLYRTERQLGFFADHDELYWNVTGNGWDFPIDQVSASVVLPHGIKRDAILLEGYTGPQGSLGHAFESSVDAQSRASFITTQPLGPQEGLTIVVSWPKGFIAPPTREMKLRWFLEDNRSTLIGLIGLVVLLVYYLIAWYFVGRDPARGVIMPLYQPPPGFSPAGVRYLVKMGFDHKTFAAAVINMAVKKFLTISEKGGVYTLTKAQADKSVLSPEEKAVADKLLGASPSIELKTANHAKIRAAIEAVKTSLSLREEKIYFFTNRRYLIPGLVFSALLLVFTALATPKEGRFLAAFMTLWVLGWSIGVILLVSQALRAWKSVATGGGSKVAALGSAVFLSVFALPFLGGEVAGLWLLASATSLGVMVVLAAVAAVNYLFHYLLKAPTRAGRRFLDRIEGFKMFLAPTEKDRLNLLTPASKTPQVFEKYLPYALALDVEQEWAEQFSDVLARAGRDGRTYSPAWYSGTGWHDLGASGFASSLGSSFSGAIASSSSPPGSSSGSGGGGSSGGGGGGGGGGGW